MTRDEFNHISAGLRGRLTALAGRFGESALLPLSAEDVAQEALAALWQLSEKNYPIRDYEAMAAYYVFNAPDEDECEFAMLLRISLSGNILSEETADEFDRLVCMHSDRPALPVQPLLPFFSYSVIRMPSLFILSMEKRWKKAVPCLLLLIK